MRSKQKTVQFTLGIVIILGTLGWLGYSGVQESKTYYVTVSELFASSEAHQRRFRVAGDVATDSIQRVEGRVRFQLQQEKDLLTVVYTGTEPLPDTLVDGAQAIVDGHYREDGSFYAEAVQAKCASKYEPAAVKAARAQGKPAS
ncbi:MAG: cytochrome c maturation protein CcmE [Acidobacteria bacterium]|nr:cytochrome c maturation protein CcmE [Acidobacteriota bacterium]